MALVQEFLPLAVPYGQSLSSSCCCQTASLGRGFTLGSACPSSHYTPSATSPSARYGPTGPLSGRKMATEKIWREFFSDPSQWCDHRLEKVNPRYPDFKHKKTQQSLWLDNIMTPPWVEAELNAMAPGILQLNVFSWNMKLQRFVKAGDYTKTMELFQQMQREGMNPDKFTFFPVLTACSGLRSLEDGRLVHQQIVDSGYECDVFLSSCLIDMYAKCGSIWDAWSVFNKMPTRDVVAWNAMILGSVKCGQGQKALDLSRQMKEEGLKPDPITFVAVLNACASLKALEDGRQVHEQIIKSDCEFHVFVGNSLIDMYAKCGSVENARAVFDTLPIRNVVAWNAMIVGYVKCLEGQNALELYRQMQQEGVEPDSVTFAAVLNACASIAALEEGRCIHEQITDRGYEQDVFVSTSLVDMYAKCGSIDRARRVFDKMIPRDVVAWNAMIVGHVKCGQGEKSLELYRQMQQEGMDPDLATFVAVLNACASVAELEEGRRIHKQIMARGYEDDVFVGSCLVDMYSKCGSIEDARTVFDKMPTKDVVPWSTLILGYVKCGEGQNALKLFRQMQQDGLDPDIATFVGVVTACTSVGALEEGRCIHEQIIERGYECDVFLGSCLVDMYAKHGSIQDAWGVFNKMPRRDVVTWTAMILGYVKCGDGLKALELYQQMQQDRVDPDLVNFAAVLSACASIAALEEGRRVHKQIIERGFECDVLVCNSLVDMYAKCGSTEDAQSVFIKMPMRDVVTWNTMILGYVKCEQGQKALELYRQMQQEGMDPDPGTFVAVLNACASLAALQEGRRVHQQVIQRGYEGDLFVGSCLVDMYAKCGSIEIARKVLDKMPRRDVVAWSAMILGYVKCGQGQKALELYRRMEQDGVDPDPVTFVAVLNACASIGSVEEGRRVHEQIIDRGFEDDGFVGNCLVDMYAKCGDIENSQKMFDRMAAKDVVSWNAIILGYVKSGEGQKALQLYRQMQQENVAPDSSTFVAVLNGCASIAALEEGKRVHDQIIKRGYAGDIFVGNALVDMYAKCANLVDAWRVFNLMPRRDVVSWNTLLAGYGRHGYAQEAREHFEQMCKVVEVNDITFVCLLSACSHGGFVDEGLSYFKSMSTVFNIHPTVEHYACVVDLLGRAGRLHEAEDLIRSMPCESAATLGLSLLSACRVHGDVELGERLATWILQLDPGNAACYVLLSNIYAAAGKWDSRARLQQEKLLERSVEKSRGRTWIEVNNEVHSFITDDREHPQKLEIHVELKRLSGMMKEAGYVPDTRFM